MGTPSMQITLADGRSLAYLDIGDPDGVPVVSCHGGLSSRLDVVPAADAAARLGVRIVAPDRPGIGGSTRLAGRALLDWPGDVAQLADALGLDRFAVLGWSAGAMYAQATAFALPDRVRALGLVASVVPPAWPEAKGLNRMDRAFVRLSGAASPLERSIFVLMRASAHHLPRAFAKSSGAPADIAEQVAAAVAEGLADTHGVTDEYRLLGADWGFDPGALRVRTSIWQGTADDLVPPSFAHALAAVIPGAELTLVDGASHFLWYDHWEEILGDLAA